MSDEPSEHPSGRRMVPQPHGGALVPGAGGGPQPGSGRTPSALKRMALKKGPKMLQVLTKIALDEDAKHSDRVAAARELLRVGMGTAYSDIQVRDNLQATIAAADRLLPEDLAAQLIFEMRRIWLG